MADETNPPAVETAGSTTPATLPPPAPEMAVAPETPVAPQPYLRADGRKSATAGRIAPHDFRHPAFLSEQELRRLRLMHEDFISYLSARFSLYLRMEFGLKLAGLTTLTYAKFTESLVHPTHLSLFKVEPLAGVGILEINPRLALALADRLLGGRGLSPKSGRHLTEIEVALLEDVMLMLLEEWSALWKAEPELKPTIIGHENNGRFLQTSPNDAIVLALSLEVNFGDCAEPIQIGVPYYMIEPVLKKLQALRQPAAPEAAPERPATWQAAYDRVTLPVRAEWSGPEFSLRDLTCLRVGDVIELPASLFQETRVLLNGTPKFIGSVGHDADRVAVQLTRQLSPEEITHAHQSVGR